MRPRELTGGALPESFVDATLLAKRTPAAGSRDRERGPQQRPRWYSLSRSHALEEINLKSMASILLQNLLTRGVEGCLTDGGFGIRLEAGLP
jgi:hypothetical protein